MRYAGIDLHKRSLTVCVIDKETGETFTSRFTCQDEAGILAFFKKQCPFEAVVEATATYEWLWVLLEPIAERLVLAHPKKLRIIAESKKKTDRFDARNLAWMLSQDEIPEAHRPTPRQREHQHLVKHRHSLRRQGSRLKIQIRSILAARNLDRPDVFTARGGLCVAELDIPQSERFRIQELLCLLKVIGEHIRTADQELKKFREAGTEAQKESHAIVQSVPGVGEVVADVVLATLGDVSRFPSIKKVTSYAGLVPGVRESDRKRRDLGITKEGPRILRWALIEAAWRAVQYSSHWATVFQRIARTRGKKRAAVAVARRLLGVIYTLLKKGERYVMTKGELAIGRVRRTKPRPRREDLAPAAVRA
jgi:transposase